MVIKFLVSIERTTEILFFPVSLKSGYFFENKIESNKILKNFLDWIIQTSSFYIHHHHHIAPSARISLALSHHPTLLSIASGRSTSCIGTELLYVSSSWLSCLCSWSGPQESYSELNYHDQKIWRTLAYDSCFNLIRSYQQYITCFPLLEIEPVTRECRAETLPLSP